MKHVTLRVNQYEEKQLHKKLEQLKLEETRNRMKYERLTTDLIFFLKENRETTGYLSKTQSFEQIQRNSVKQISSTEEEEIHDISEDDNASTLSFNNNNDHKIQVKKGVRPQTANARLATINEKLSNRRQSAPIFRSTNHATEINNNNKSTMIRKLSTSTPITSTTPTSSTSVSTSSSLDKSINTLTTNVSNPNTPRIINQNDIIQISTNNRYLIHNNKYFKQKFAFNFINNTKITINMSKNFIKKEKLRIIYENKLNKNAEIMASLRKIQSVFDFKVKKFTENVA